eukprot:Filipodium_phascolosomae@DN2750_c1_g1_i9.p2
MAADAPLVLQHNPLQTASASAATPTRYNQPGNQGTSQGTSVPTQGRLCRFAAFQLSRRSLRGTSVCGMFSSFHLPNTSTATVSFPSLVAVLFLWGTIARHALVAL